MLIWHIFGTAAGPGWEENMTSTKRPFGNIRRLPSKRYQVRFDVW
jgi:hypothetical protein